MDFKKFLPSKDEQKEYFWSLVIEPGWVQAGIWRIDSDKAQVVLSSPAFAWETDEELIQATDDALSSAIQGFPEENPEPVKSVFGVSAGWVEGGEIASKYLDKIKKLCSELSLTPIGFVVLPEAIAHFIKSEEGGPLTAVVLGVYNQTIELSLFKLGNLSGSTSISRSVSIVDDVIEGFARLSGTDHVPSRFILYDGKEGELEEARQALLKVNWEDYDNLKLLHTPKVELIDTKMKVHAVCLAGASELADVSKVEALIQKDDQFGETIADHETKVDTKPLVEDLPETSPEDLGFVMEKDISKSSDVKSIPETENFDEVTSEAQIDGSHQNVVPIEQAKPKRKLAFDTKKIGSSAVLLKNKVVHFLGELKLPKLGSLGAGKSTLVYGIGFLLLLIVLGFLAWWYLPKSEVTVYVSPKRLEESFDLSVEVDGSSDFSQRKLKGKLVSEEVDGEKTKDTTGTKTVGDKAKGEVTIYRVGSQITLPVGTTFTGPNSLKFTLDGEVVVASGSASSAGTTKAAVTAEDIGTDYNLASGAEFSVGNFSAVDMEAKNEAAFSGGSSREISAVSEDDQETLQEELADELEEKATELVRENLDEGDYFLEDSLTATASGRTFNAKVGDEAGNLKLSLSLEASGISVSQKELVELSTEVLKGKIPQGFTLRGEQLDYQFDLERSTGDEYEFEVRVSANLLPGVNTDDVVQKIKGRQLEFAQEFMQKEVPGFVRAEIKIKPTLPGKLKTLPHLAKNITIEVAAER